jgi:hypothetical protein
MKTYENFSNDNLYGYESEEAFKCAKDKIDILKSKLEENGIEYNQINPIELEWYVNGYKYEASYQCDEDDIEYGDNFYTFGWRGPNGDDGQWDTSSVNTIINSIKK